MATLAAPLPGVGVGTAPVKKEPEIVVIPNEFYAVALKLKVAVLKEQVNAPTPLPPPPPKPAAPAAALIRPPVKAFPWAPITAGLGMVLIVGGVFLYLNRDLLFKKPAPVPVVEAPPALPAAPTAPTNLVATSSAGAVSLSWVDTSGEETGYRVERKEESSGVFIPLTNLSTNSTAFLDPSAQPSLRYSYRVIALNAGGESAPSNEMSVVLPALPIPEPPRPTLPPGGLDSDSDGLSDVEETMFGTDSRNPDTDGDSHLDGNEVFHLYNPAASAPGKLVESGLVKVLNNAIGWSVLVPNAWTERPDATDPSKTIIDTSHGETFSVFLSPNTQNQTLKDWYAAARPNATGTTREVTTKGGLRGLVGADQLEVFFLWQDKIFIIRYDLNGQNFVNFRTTYEMMLNSLKLTGAPVVPSTLSPVTDGPGALLEGTSSSTPSTTSVTTTSAVPTAAATSTSVAPTASSSTPVTTPATASSTRTTTTTTTTTATTTAASTSSGSVVVTSPPAS